ncbi:MULTISPECIES: Bug family tripartite tricarboxylate transporter substrate binding protein [Microvirga]|uniref:Bug family tripartite tricarboxylate transporter substrate binding protein n=1 Tax=Microvirga TaxID=186650 RepID=UPI0021C5CE01|nr:MULTISPECIES: tripartite tricarboxylate transporter substrate-binding protein [unclassified Microvirga]
MSLDRRSFNKALLAAASASLLPALPAWAQQLTSVKIVAPAGPGGGYDQLARAVQEVLMSEKLATSVQVQNVPGAGGTIGLAQVINSKERDPSLMVAGFGLVGAPVINKSPVTLEQVTPIARLQGEYQPLFVAAESPIKSVTDLVNKFKQDPGSVTWGGFAHGSPDHVLCGLVVKASGGDVKKMNYIPVGTGGEMLPLVMNGKITVATGGLNEVAGQFKAGKLRPIGISSPERLPGIDIPTFREQGVDATLVNWRGLMASPHVSAEDKQALEAAVAKLVQSPSWKKLLQEREWVDLYMPSAPFGAFIKEEQARITAILKELGLG